MIRAIRSTLALVVVVAATLVATLTPAGAGGTRDADGVPWGRLDVVELLANPGPEPGGQWILAYRDTARDGQCVRGALVDEDGTIRARGPRSCGRWVNWHPPAMAEDWPAPVLIRSDGTRSPAQPPGS